MNFEKELRELVLKRAKDGNVPFTEIFGAIKTVMLDLEIEYCEQVNREKVVRMEMRKKKEQNP